MKKINLMIATTMVVSILATSSVSAQAITDRNTPTERNDTNNANNDNNNSNSGWIGLLGLIGLAGFLKKNKDESVVRQTTTTPKYNS